MFLFQIMTIVAFLIPIPICFH
uniref:Uncharacterized protein n=1 Tax=Anguilla anguilla TaxID=7936 RepID=A0A0E9TT07_ANGAN